MPHRLVRLAFVRSSISFCLFISVAGAQTVPTSLTPSPTPTPIPVPVTIEKAAPDAPVPDLGKLPTERPVPKTVPQKIKRKLTDAAPKCLDAILHTCWAQPSADGPEPKTPAEAEYLKDIDVGDFNFKTRNYPGAELRYVDALKARPNAPEATFKLALTRERLGKVHEAGCGYEAFLKLNTDSPFAGKARKGLERLNPAGGPISGCPSMAETQ